MSTIYTMCVLFLRLSAHNLRPSPFTCMTDDDFDHWEKIDVQQQIVEELGGGSINDVNTN